MVIKKRHFIIRNDKEYIKIKCLAQHITNVNVKERF